MHHRLFRDWIRDAAQEEGEDEKKEEKEKEKKKICVCVGVKYVCGCV